MARKKKSVFSSDVKVENEEVKVEATIIEEPKDVIIEQPEQEPEVTVAEKVEEIVEEVKVPKSEKAEEVVKRLSEEEATYNQEALHIAANDVMTNQFVSSLFSVL